jgi:hypothetical protein
MAGGRTTDRGAKIRRARIASEQPVEHLCDHKTKERAGGSKTGALSLALAVDYSLTSPRAKMLAT